MIPDEGSLRGRGPNIRPIVVPVRYGILPAKIIPEKWDTQNVKGGVGVVYCVWNVILECSACVRR